MDIINRFFNLFQETSNVSERVKVLNIKLTSNNQKLPPKEQIIKFISDFPERDIVKLRLVNDYDNSIEFTNTNTSTDDKIDLELYEEIKNDDSNIEILLDIYKNITNNTISVYSFKEFSNHILNKSLLDSLEIFNELLSGQDYLIFELFDSNLLFSTQSMIFKSYSNKDFTLHFSRNNKINACNDISKFPSTSTLTLIPDDFDITLNTKNNIFESLFSKLKTLLCMIYISNTSRIEKIYCI